MSAPMRCRVHQVELVESIVGIPHCPSCTKDAAKDTPTIAPAFLAVLRAQLETKELVRAE